DPLRPDLVGAAKQFAERAPFVGPVGREECGCRVGILPRERLSIGFHPGAKLSLSHGFGAVSDTSGTVRRACKRRDSSPRRHSFVHVSDTGRRALVSEYANAAKADSPAPAKSQGRASSPPGSAFRLPTRNSVHPPPDALEEAE